MSKNNSVWKKVSIAAQTGFPTLLWGEPGIGKTAQIVQMAESFDCHLETVIASIREPSDFAGLPVVTSDGSVRFAPPAWAESLIHTKKRGMLFLDEISTAPPATQAALLRVVLDKVIGEQQLPESTLIVAAANPPECAAGGWDLAPPLANRFFHFEIKPRVDEWCDWALGIPSKDKYTTLPKTWKARKPEMMALISSFIKSRQSQLQAMPENANSSRSWASPRTWEMAGSALAACLSIGEPRSGDISTNLVAAAVGEAAAIELTAYLGKVELPDPEDLLKNPAIWDVKKERSDLVYAVLASVVGAVAATNTIPRWTASWAVVARVNEAGKPDVALTAAHSLAKIRPEGAKAPKELNMFPKFLRKCMS